MAFGRSWVSGRTRVPLPAARIIPFTLVPLAVLARTAWYANGMNAL
jgi:hypothetical protein